MITFDATCTGGRSEAAEPLVALRRAHLVGIGGAGMRSLADVLDEAGWRVSGSDLAGAAGPFDVHVGHSADYIDENVDLVVHSDAVPRDNPELRRARQLGIRSLSYPQMLGELMIARQGVAIAGTHGKSTTTAMAGAILASAGLDPAVVVGAAPIRATSGGRFGRGPMVVEACEYRANFLNLHPHLAAILNVEPDHFDCFASQAELEHAFGRFAGQVAPEGVLLVRHECVASRTAALSAHATVETFGFEPDATWQARELRERLGYYSFEIVRGGEYICEIKLPVPGRHNVLNALAAAALASHCGANERAIRQGLELFVGLRRRLQLLGVVRDVTIVDDYAHHPTEVTAALATLRAMYPGRRVVCVFQPHQASRLAGLLDEFARSLHNADQVVLADVFRARESADDSGTMRAEMLQQRLAEQGVRAIYLDSAQAITNHLKQSLLPGDVLVTMGAGDIGTVAHELGKGLRTFRKAV